MCKCLYLLSFEKKMATWYNSPNLGDESRPVRALLLHDRIFPSEEWARGTQGTRHILPGASGYNLFFVRFETTDL